MIDVPIWLVVSFSSTIDEAPTAIKGFQDKNKADLLCGMIKQASPEKRVEVLFTTCDTDV